MPAGVTSVLHIIDDCTDETQLQVLGLLHRRLQERGARQAICRVGSGPACGAVGFVDGQIAAAPYRLLRELNWTPGLAVVARNCGAKIVHAWGVDAARTAGATLSHLPLVLTLLDPASTRNAARSVQALPVGASIAAGSQVIRTRLVSAGLPNDRVVVIRGGVDFGAINAARRLSLRKECSVEDGSPVVLLNGPPSRGGGQYHGVWASAIVRQIHRGLKVIMPYGSRESHRLLRFVRQINMSDMLVVPNSRWTWAQLVSCADMFLCPSVEDVCAEPLAWAMAAGVSVVACAVRSVCELIADKHNGFLCKPAQPRALAARILAAWEDVDLRRRVSDVARAQAYEVFGVRVFAEHYERLYDNALSSRAVGEGIDDTAMVA